MNVYKYMYIVTPYLHLNGANTKLRTKAYYLRRFIIRHVVVFSLFGNTRDTLHMFSASSSRYVHGICNLKSQNFSIGCVFKANRLMAAFQWGKLWFFHIIDEHGLKGHGQEFGVILFFGFYYLTMLKECIAYEQRKLKILRISRRIICKIQRALTILCHINKTRVLFLITY